ncbi:hypothetical protein BgAZ_106480 [Babesia gibsoni]|uniref:Uncharacterized protein n=1 Tax=Babesia gibsoni TaxID=33632 RepID=A0AAD8PGE5_BABGI|nr:hypothetical protein BgAZ_106480 [Babesia gibsoni]
MNEVECSVSPHSPVFGNAEALKAELPLEEIPGHHSLYGKVMGGDDSNIMQPKLSEEDLMQIIYTLEQERETYLEGVAVLQQKFLESEERYQQLVDSHTQTAKNLEEELSEVWKEAENWKAKYTNIDQTIKKLGLDEAKLEQYAASVDACTVVTSSDLDSGNRTEGNFINIAGLQGKLKEHAVVAQNFGFKGDRGGATSDLVAQGPAGQTYPTQQDAEYTLRDFPTFRCVGDQFTTEGPNSANAVTSERHFDTTDDHVNTNQGLMGTGKTINRVVHVPTNHVNQGYGNFYYYPSGATAPEQCLSYNGGAQNFYLDGQRLTTFDEWVYVGSPRFFDDSHLGIGDQWHEDTKRACDVLVDAMTY